MAYALVGSIGTNVTGTTSVSPSFGQTPTANNLLVAWVGDTAATINTPSGWTKIAGSNMVFYYKVAAGSDAAPTFSDASATFMTASLGEFSGGATSSLEDQNANNVGTTSPQTPTCGAADTASGELWVGGVFLTYSMSATKVTTWSLNNGAITAFWDNDSVSSANHYRFGYCVTTSNASADANTETFTTTNISTHTFRMQTFNLPAAGGTTVLDPFGASGFFGA
jgi:hypothetical protein